MKAFGYALAFAALLSTGSALALDFDLELPMRAGRYAEVVERAQPKQGDLSSVETSRLVYLCYSYSRLKDYSKLSKCLDAIEKQIAGGDKSAAWPLLPFELNMTPFPHWLRAEAMIDLGSYDDAVSEARKAYDIVVKQDLTRGWSVHTLSVLGLAEALRGDKDAARDHAKALADISTFYPFGQLSGDKWIGTAKIYMALHNYKDSLEAVRRHESEGAILRGFANAVLGGQMLVYQELPVAFITCKSLFETGDNEQAGECYDTLLKAPAVQWNGEIYWVLLFDRGRLAESRSQFAEAIQMYEHAIDIIERQRSTINAEASRIGFVGDKQAVYERLIRLLIDQQRMPEAFDYVERSKARALVDMLATKRDFTTPVDGEKTRRILAQLDAADAASRMLVDVQAADTATRNIDAARKEIRQGAPELATLVTVTSVPPDELRSLISEEEALVEYYYQDKELYAFVLHHDRLTAAKLDASGLASAVQDFRSAIEEVTSDKWRDGARALHARLWQPIEPLIGGTKVIVVAHGALHYLPFAALMGPDGKLVIDHYSLRFLPSASVLKYLKPPTKKDGALLALGNPDLGDARLDLKFAEDEAREVAKLSPEARLLVRKDASETNLKKAGGAFSRIHFATHGKFQPDEPLASGLYLAKDAENDGVLTVGELYSMQLDTDLVTLSACETGLGKVANGDDVVGLTRGFLYAGSRSIVASLWSVDDKATATLMETFYEGLKQQSKQEALRAAQLKTRESFPPPFFWAAFQLTGRAN